MPCVDFITYKSKFSTSSPASQELLLKEKPYWRVFLLLDIDILVIAYNKKLTYNTSAQSSILSKYSLAKNSLKVIPAPSQKR